MHAIQQNGPLHVLTGFRLSSQEIDRSRQNGGEDNPEQRIPVQEGYADECRIGMVVERCVQHGDKGNDEKDEKPPSTASPGLGCHRHYSFRLSPACGNSCYEMMTGTKRTVTGCRLYCTLSSTMMSMFEKRAFCRINGLFSCYQQDVKIL